MKCWRPIKHVSQGLIYFWRYRNMLFSSKKAGLGTAVINIYPWIQQPLIRAMADKLLSLSFQVSAKFGTYTVMGLNGTLDEAEIFTFTLGYMHFIFNKCPIQDHDGANAKFTTTWDETDYSVPLRYFRTLMALECKCIELTVHTQLLFNFSRKLLSIL